MPIQHVFLIRCHCNNICQKTCSLRIGERVNHPTKHRRMVNTNISHSRNFYQAESINVQTHHGITISFKRVLSTKKNRRTSNREKLNIRHSTKNHIFWHGESIDGSSLNYLIDSKGNVRGSLVILKEDAIYQLHSQADGSMIVTITPSTDFDAELEPPAIENHMIYDRRTLYNSTSTLVERNSNRLPSIRISNPNLSHDVQDEWDVSSARALYDDSGGNLDIMVLWTENAECENAGLSRNCKLSSTTYDYMMALVELAIEETNTAFSMSGVHSQLLLVHADRLLNYSDDDVDMFDVLMKLRNGTFTGVHENRSTYGADLVSLLNANPVGCGISFLGPGKNSMFSVTKHSCATGFFTFGHEIGHNLGLHHDRGTKNQCNVDNGRYNYGWRDPNSKFRTIMAYNCRSSECDNHPGHRCTRIQRFSTTSSLYNGDILGNYGSDNARAINDVRVAVAGYYSHKTPISNTGTPSIAPTTVYSSTPSLNPSALESNFLAGYCGNNLCEPDMHESWFSCPEDCSFPNVKTYSVGHLSLTSLRAGVNTGLMFDLESLNNDITLYGFDMYMHYAALETKIEVYVTAKYNSTFVGKEEDSSEWMKVMRQTLSWSERSVIEINLTIPIRMVANTIRGVYITIDNSKGYELVVSQGTMVGTVIDSTNDIRIKEGTWNYHKFGGHYQSYRLLGRAKYFLNTSTCSIATVLNKTYYLEAEGACWRLQLFAGGTLERDPNPQICSKDEFNSSTGAFSIFYGVNLEENRVIFVDGPQSYSGTFQFTESIGLTQPQVLIRHWNEIEQEYVVEVILPSCA